MKNLKYETFKAFKRLILLFLLAFLENVFLDIRVILLRDKILLENFLSVSLMRNHQKS